MLSENLQEEWREGQKELHYVFVDLEKSVDRVHVREVFCEGGAGHV